MCLQNFTQKVLLRFKKVGQFMYVYNFSFCRLYAQTQDLQIFKKFYMSQTNPEEFVYNTAYSVQLPYKAGLSL